MDEKTITTYNQMAKEYDEETTDFWKRFPQTFIKEFAKLSKGKILDIGSGPGRDAMLLKEKGLDVTCLDASQAMLKICKKRGLKTILSDFKTIPCEDNSCSGIWAYTSLLHVPKNEISEVIKEIKRVLKSDGILGLGLIEGEGEIYKESAGVNMPRLFSYYQKSEIEEILKNHGFELVYYEDFKPRKNKYLNFIFKNKK